VHDGTGVVTKRMSTHSLTTRPSDTPPNTFYDGRITDIGGISRQIFANGSTSGRASVDEGFVEFSNADGALDDWPNFGFGRQLTIKSLISAASTVSSAETQLIATVEGIQSPDALHTLRLALRGRMFELDAPLLTTRYLGTTVSIESTDLAEGDVDLKDTIKPQAYGANLNVAGILVNKARLIYQFADNPQLSITPYDGGISAGFTYDGDVGTILALTQITVPAGHYATCLAKGCVRFGFNPAFEVTADLVEGATPADRSAARVIQRMLILVPTISPGDIDAASFDAFHAINPAIVGILIESDSSAIDLISQVADSVGGAVLDNALGKFQAVFNNGPAAATNVTLTLRDLISGGAVALELFASVGTEAQGKPAWSVIVNYGKIWHPQDSGQLAPVIAEATTGEDLARKQLVANNSPRQVVQQNSAVKDKHPLAIELTFDTLLANLADATAEATRRLALYSVRRDRLTFPVAMDSQDKGNVELGQTVRVQLDDIGRYDAGTNMLVLGRQDDWARRQRVLSLWG
jgi:hypothetical protein